MGLSFNKFDLLASNPIDQVAEFVTSQNWFLHRSSAASMMAEVPGRWGHHKLLADWYNDEEVLDVSCVLDLTFDDIQISEVNTLISLLNQELWLGHFIINEGNYSIKLSHKLMLRGTEGATAEQIEDIIEILLGEAEQAFPTIYQVLNGPYAARDIVPLGMTQSHGQA